MVRNLEAGKGFSDTLDLLVAGPDLGRGVACTLSPLGDTPTAMAPLKPIPRSPKQGRVKLNGSQFPKLHCLATSLSLGSIEVMRTLSLE
jgi:hypothetical protein